jgi:nuclear transport factor 2 (NTF2) superfamily protein
VETTESRPPFPPFTLETAVQKVRAAEDGWNSRNPEKVALAYSVESRWRNRSELIVGRGQIVAFLRRKWMHELDYRLIKELWAFRDIGSPCVSPTSGMTTRKIGSALTAMKNWEFDEHGLMTARHASINDLPIHETERKYHWPLGQRPLDHPELSSFGF